MGRFASSLAGKDDVQIFRVGVRGSVRLRMQPGAAAFVHADQGASSLYSSGMGQSWRPVGSANSFLKASLM